MTELPSQDQLFLRKLSEIVEFNISREEFDVEHLAQQANMSRSAIHRRLRNLGKSNASHFIREIRLQKAREMLHNGFSTASEVAYRVGFGSPTYFSKCYHEYYGYPPGEERKLSVSVEPVLPEVKKTGNGSHNRDVVPGLRRRGKIIIITALSLAFFLFLLMLALNPFRHAKDMSIVVLPFRSLSADIENQYFADGIMEDILNSLCQVNSMRVVSRTTSEHFRNTNLTAGEIARKLNVRNVLEGSVRREGDRVRITIQLIDGQNERHIWSETFDRTLGDMLGIQDEIARQVAAKLNPGITSDEELLTGDDPPAYPQALN
ncbi:MAG: helix-turn-helix domain-containing protein [Bacteroidales bacterium]